MLLVITLLQRHFRSLPTVLLTFFWCVSQAFEQNKVKLESERTVASKLGVF
jgi:hypothetical protein